MEEHLDFVVLVAHAVPVLSRAINAAAAGTQAIPLSPADHFTQHQLSSSQLLHRSKIYQAELARTLIITDFSYFEAFIKGLIREFVDFHGGPSGFLALANRRSRKFLSPLPPDLLKAKRKLQEPDTKPKGGKYKKHSATLARAGFRFPTELLAAYGVERLLDKISTDRRLELKAGEIPDLLVQAFHVDAFTKHKSDFDAARRLRNDIAHGARRNITLKEAIEVGRRLRQWAVEVDQHFVEHYFVLEKYVV